MASILIVDRVHPYLSEQLQAQGFDCTTNLSETYEQFCARPDNLFGLVIRSRFVVDRALLDTKPSLRFIVRIGAGVENIDVALRRRHAPCRSRWDRPPCTARRGCRRSWAYSAGGRP